MGGKWQGLGRPKKKPNLGVNKQKKNIKQANKAHLSLVGTYCMYMISLTISLYP